MAIDVTIRPADAAARRFRAAGVFMIPSIDVESELLRNPGIEDVALVGYPDELRRYLTDQGMTEWYLPTRVEHVESLPRNGNGKVRKELLRRWLVGQASLSD